MNRRYRCLTIALIVAGAWLLAPQLAYADNCSSLNDCYYTLRAALAAAVGLGVFAALTAIGLDLGPFARKGRRREMDGGGVEGGPAAGADAWDRSLGMVSVEGLVPRQMGQQAPTPGGQEAVSTQSEAPGASSGEVREGMRPARKESDLREVRTAEQGRGAATAEEPAAGRSGEWSGRPGGSAEAAGDSGDVVDRARDVEEAFGEPQGMAQAEKGLAGSTQSRAPGDTVVDDGAVERMAQSEQGPRPMGQQSARLADAAPAPDVGGEALAEGPGSSIQGSPPQAPATSPREGELRTAGEAIEAPSVAEPAAEASGLADELLQAYGELGRIPGVRLLAQQAAAHTGWAARGAIAHLDMARRLQERATPGGGIARLADVAAGRAGADIVLADGSVLEVKSYYWPGPFFQEPDNVAEATRRLIRQAALLERRYVGGAVQFIFSDLAGMPQGMRTVLQSAGVSLVEAESAPPRPEAVAGEPFVERLRGMTVDEYGRGLLRAGWRDTSAATARRLRGAFAHDPGSAWLALAVWAFDAECIYETNVRGESYAAQLALLAAHSDGALEVENVVERVEGETVTVTFESGGQSLSRQMAAASDYFAAALFEMVNEAIGEQGEVRRFIPLPSPDQMLYVAFIEEVVYRGLTAAGLIPAPM